MSSPRLFAHPNSLPFILHLEAWQNDSSEELLVYIGGFRVKGVSLQLEQSMEKFLNATANQGKRVDPDAKDTLMAIDDFASAYSRFKDTNDSGSMDGSIWGRKFDGCSSSPCTNRYRSPTRQSRLFGQFSILSSSVLY